MQNQQPLSDEALKELARGQDHTIQRTLDVIESNGNQRDREIFVGELRRLGRPLPEPRAAKPSPGVNLARYRVPAALTAILVLMAFLGGNSEQSGSQETLMKAAGSEGLRPLVLNRRREPYQKLSLLEVVLPSSRFVPGAFEEVVSDEHALGASRILIRVLDQPGGRITHEMVLVEGEMPSMNAWNGPVQVAGLRGFWKEGGPGL